MLTTSGIGVVFLAVVAGVYTQGLDNSVCNNLAGGSGNTVGSRCESFYSCWKYINKAEMTCPGDTYFNPESQSCDLDSEDCGAFQRSTQPYCRTAADPNDCNLFAFCFLRTMIYRFRCPTGTMFHNRFRVCVHPTRTLMDRQGCKYISSLESVARTNLK